MSTKEPSGRGNAWLRRYTEDAARESAVEKVLEEMIEDDRVYAMNLAAIRKAGELTQVQLAERLGVGQDVVSRTERRPDMLLKTLRDYLAAAGAEDIAITMTVSGRRIELALPFEQDRIEASG